MPGAAGAGHRQAPQLRRRPPLSVFAIADTRRRETYCKGTCGHAWHNLPAATEQPWHRPGHHLHSQPPPGRRRMPSMLEGRARRPGQ
ncbi:DUF5958 family protein [Streptomyces sp. NBC_01549]|uniref:DUF5958 family protein n=1 Tax=Streptomyces sp. NBC_01549 TaxID=2975874 RepID=UPI00338E960A